VIYLSLYNTNFYSFVNKEIEWWKYINTNKIKYLKEYYKLYPKNILQIPENRYTACYNNWIIKLYSKSFNISDKRLLSHELVHYYNNENKNKKFKENFYKLANNIKFFITNSWYIIKNIKNNNDKEWNNFYY